MYTVYLGVPLFSTGFCFEKTALSAVLVLNTHVMQPCNRATLVRVQTVAQARSGQQAVALSGAAAQSCRHAAGAWDR